MLEQAIAIDRHTPAVVLTRSVDMPWYLDAMQLVRGYRLYRGTSELLRSGPAD